MYVYVYKSPLPSVVFFQPLAILLCTRGMRRGALDLVSRLHTVGVACPCFWFCLVGCLYSSSSSSNIQRPFHPSTSYFYACPMPDWDFSMK